jgi:hypothetical protein
MSRIIRRIAVFAAFLFAATGIAGAADQPREIRVDYAYYSPPSLVLKRFGWLEQEFKADQIPIKWVLSQGSNRALEFLNSGSIDFGSSAGLAAVLSKANGNPIKGVYIYSRPEWTALVVAKDSPIRSIKDLKGKKVAATKGTDPSCSCCAACTWRAEEVRHRACQPAARRWPRRSRTGQGRRLGRPRPADGCQRDRGRLEADLSQRGVQHLRLSSTPPNRSATVSGITSGASLPPTRRRASGSSPTRTKLPKSSSEEAKLSLPVAGCS